MTEPSATDPSSLDANFNVFAGDLFDAVVGIEQNSQNFVFSPATIHSLLGLIFMGANSTTRHELRRSLRLSPRMSLDEIAQHFGNFITEFFRSDIVSESVCIKMVNRIYINDKYQLKSEFNEMAEKYFASTVIKMDFTKSLESATTINAWVEEQTEQKIKNILHPEILNGDTSILLVNAIYFKGLWEQPFSLATSQLMDFYNNEKEIVTVNMMYNDGRYAWKELRSLEATALEIPYKASKLSMIILLPKNINGLNEMEQKLEKRNLNALLVNMKMEAVDLFLPKFKIETALNLRAPLEKLGNKILFTDLADFTGFLVGKNKQKISDVRHRAYLEINEAGSEVRVTSFMKLIPVSLNLKQKVFKVDHPFLFAIRSPDAVYFIGHVKKL